MKNLLKYIVLATLVATISIASAQTGLTTVDPDEVGYPTDVATGTQTQPQGNVPDPVAPSKSTPDFTGEINDLRSKIDTLESQRQNAHRITNVTVRNRTLRVIQDVSARYKSQLDVLEDHVRRVLQPELARVRGYASEGVRLGRKHESDISALQTRIAALEALVLASSTTTGGTAPAVPPTTPVVPPVTGTGAMKMSPIWFQEALQGAGQILTILGVIVVVVLVMVGLFNLIQHGASLRAANAAAERRDAREDARIARTPAAAQWGAEFTDKPDWAEKGKVSFARKSHADGSFSGSSSGEYKLL